MDWTAFSLSISLATWTTLVLLPLGVVVARVLAWRNFPGKGFAEAFIALPLVLPPTVLGYYLLVSFSDASVFGGIYEKLSGRSLAFSFDGLLLASVIFNLPFAIQPMQRAFEAIPRDVREAAWCSGISHWRTFLRIEFPLAWPGILSGLILTFAHTLGEFGVVLMIGGNIPGETRTIAISIYDRVQAFDMNAAAAMSAVLLAFSFIAIGLVQVWSARMLRRHA